MKLNRAGAWLGGMVLVCIAGTGCVVAESPGPDGCAESYYCNRLGDIVITWSIDGDESGDQCASHGAAQIEVKITDASGNLADDWQLPCSSEGTDETLAPGTYTAAAQLQDANGNPITTVDPTQITILPESSSSPLDFDFDDDSFTNHG